MQEHAKECVDALNLKDFLMKRKCKTRGKNSFKSLTTKPRIIPSVCCRGVPKHCVPETRRKENSRKWFLKNTDMSIDKITPCANYGNVGLHFRKYCRFKNSSKNLPCRTIVLKAIVKTISKYSQQKNVETLC